MLPINGLATETDQPSPVETWKSYTYHNQQTNYHINKTLVTWNIVYNERVKFPVRQSTLSANKFSSCWYWVKEKYTKASSRQHVMCTEIPAISAAEEMNSKDSGYACHKDQDDNCWNDRDHSWKNHFPNLDASYKYSYLSEIVQQVSVWTHF